MKIIKQFAAAARSVRDFVSDWAPDGMMLAGAGLVSYGASLIYFPAGFIVGGALLLALGYFTRSGN